MKGLTALVVFSERDPGALDENRKDQKGSSKSTRVNSADSKYRRHLEEFPSKVCVRDLETHAYEFESCSYGEEH